MNQISIRSSTFRGASRGASRSPARNTAWGTLLGSGLLAGALLVHPATSSAHARLDTPPARDFGKAGADSHKDPNGPCGKIAPTTTPVRIQAGSTIEVKWTETVNHPGCFLISLSDKKDPTVQGDFTMDLANIKHTTQGAIPRAYSAMVKLPDGVSCPQCTLQLRQIMLGSDTAACPPATVAYGATYYTCTDVTLEAPAAPDMGSTAVDMAAGGGPDLAPTPTDPGGASTGCSVRAGSAVPVSGGGALLALLLGSTALRLRRRPLRRDR